MRKTLLLIISLMCIGVVYSEDYTYLTIVQQDGTKTSLTAVGLSMKFADGNLTVNNAYTDESKTIALSNLVSMNFSNSNETTGISDIKTNGNAGLDGAEAIYTLQGQRIPEGKQMPKGVYIIKKGNVTQKLQVR